MGRCSINEKEQIQEGRGEMCLKKCLVVTLYLGTHHKQ